MQQNPAMLDVNLWRASLGLFPVPLFNAGERAQSFVMLNGSQGNFCLDIGHTPLGTETRNFAWSSNVGHYISLSGESIEVQRWDQSKASIQRYSRQSVYDNLEKFHSFLEKDSPKRDLSIVAHAIRVFRSLRALLGETITGADSLKAFLYLLACATDRVERRNLQLETWRLSSKAAEVAARLTDIDWATLERELILGIRLESLVPELSLMLRHAAGQLFQEAHYEAIFVPQRQLSLGGFLPAPISVSKGSDNIGVHFTPAALARTLVEESLTSLDLPSESVTIFDPACGSGEFLREAVRQLTLRKYPGLVRVIGWDSSTVACDMANFVLAWEQRNSQVRMAIQIDCLDSLSPEVDWPMSVDMILMNPPFLSWQDMSMAQRATVSETLGNLVKKRPDLAHAFLWKASFSLRANGVLGSILPASILDSESASPLRNELAHKLSPKLLARLGSQYLFGATTVDTALYVAENVASSKEPPVAFWADHRVTSTSAGLRTLRKIRYLEEPTTSPVLSKGFDIYHAPALGRSSGNWTPRPYNSWKMLQNLGHLPRVSDLYDVKMGVRSGKVNTFVIKQSEWLDLPETEQEYFRPAVVNKSIQFGYLRDAMYIFYPYGEKELQNEAELQEVLPQYYSTRLLPARDSLSNRSRANKAKWWQLSERTPWQLHQNPQIVSTYFGGIGSFAWDRQGGFVVVQGWGWLPKVSWLRKHDRVLTGNETLPDTVWLAYLAILNSPLFAELLLGTSKNVGGGQWNLSKKYVSSIPLPDLLAETASPTIILELARIGKDICEGRGLPHKDEQLIESLNVLYGLSEKL